MKTKTADGIRVYCSHDKIVNIDELKPNPKNPNQHPDEQIELLSKIILQNGWRDRITVSNLSGLIVKGHGRYMAAIGAGLGEVPVDYQDYEDAAAEYADLIADNKIAELSEVDNEAARALIESLDNFDIDSLDLSCYGFLDDEIADIFPELAPDDSKDDEVPEIDEDEEPITKRGDLYLLGEHRVLCGDATKREDVERLVDGRQADMCFTDPPYGVSLGAKNRMLNTFQKAGRCLKDIENDSLSEDDLKEMLVIAFKNTKNISNAHCSYYVFAPQGGNLGLMMMMMMQEVGLPVRHVLNWIKNQPTFSMGRLDYDYQHEPILYCWNKSHEFFSDGSQTKSTWFFDRPRENKLHPTMKPVAIIENAILNSTKKGWMVFDCFMGSGSTLIACEKTNRICYGMEIDPHYCDVVVKRWEDYTGKKAVRG